MTLQPWLAQLASVSVSLAPRSAKLMVQSAAQQPPLMPASLITGESQRLFTPLHAWFIQMKKRVQQNCAERNPSVKNMFLFGTAVKQRLPQA